MPTQCRLASRSLLIARRQRAGASCVAGAGRSGSRPIRRRTTHVVDPLPERVGQVGAPGGLRDVELEVFGWRTKRGEMMVRCRLVDVSMGTIPARQALPSPWNRALGGLLLPGQAEADGPARRCSSSAPDASVARRGRADLTGSPACSSHRWAIRCWTTDGLGSASHPTAAIDHGYGQPLGGYEVERPALGRSVSPKCAEVSRPVGTSHR